MTAEEYKTIKLYVKNRVARLVFDRPHVHNAFDAGMLSEISGAVTKVKEDSSVRVLVLTGNGKSFCSGADLKWMREIVDYTFEQNLEETRHLAELMYSLYMLPKPTVAMVNGSAIGGGTGFISACDIAVASEDAKFGLSEVKIGLVPAAISPYVIRKIGESKAREYFLTGRRITARKAMEIGLLSEVVPKEELGSRVDEIVNQLLSSGPEAIANCKELILKVPHMGFDEAKEFTARMIANLRVSEEGQEGTAAFLEKRKPSWAADAEAGKGSGSETEAAGIDPGTGSKTEKGK